MKTQLALQLAILLIQQGGKLALAYQKAVNAGREDLTEEELDDVFGSDDESRARFQAQIDAVQKQIDDLK